MTSLVIVEAERGVTHLMLILDLDGANEANGREADEQETQQLRQREPRSRLLRLRRGDWLRRRRVSRLGRSQDGQEGPLAPAW